MVLYGASDGNRRLHLGKTYALDVALAIFVLVGSTANSPAQLPSAAANCLSTRLSHCALRRGPSNYGLCLTGCKACWTNILRSNLEAVEFGS